MAGPNVGSMLDQLASRHDEDPYEDIASDERPLEFLGRSSIAREALYDSRSVSRIIDHRRRYDDYREREYIETVLASEPTSGLRDYSSSSANSLDDLCRGHQRIIVDFNRAEATSNARDQYMIPTRDPRELNERILSLFNPQFLPNFNDMIMYVASQCDTRRTPPPRSRSMAEGEDRFFRDSSSCRKNTSSMFFRRGLTYESPRK